MQALNNLCRWEVGSADSDVFKIKNPKSAIMSWNGETALRFFMAIAGPGE